MDGIYHPGDILIRNSLAEEYIGPKADWHPDKGCLFEDGILPYLFRDRGDK